MGGAFNPPHLGHLVCAQEARYQLGLDRLLIVPARVPPHKVVEDEPGPEHRLELCRMAVGGDEAMRVCDLEIRRPGPSFTVDTLVELRAQEPQSELYLIVGGDAAAGLPGWREPDRILSMATLAVARRRGTAKRQVRESLAGLPGGDRTTFFRMPRIAISSTMIRDRVRTGQPIRYLVPQAVSTYIDQKGLYR